MGTFVLIHGGWHAAWCWSKITGLLTKNGHQVIAPDLPAHGADPTPLTAKPYELYVPRVCEILDALPAPTILVGHSSGGMIIDEVARRRSNKVQSLVFLSAFLLPPGKSPRDVMLMDQESILRSSLEIDVARGISSVKRDCARSVFYEDCSDEDAEWAIHQLEPEPLIPPGSPTSNTLPNPSPSGVPRFYIECLRDRALGPLTQKWMYTQTPCDAVYSLNTSHSPFLSAPVALSDYLMEIADRTRV